MISRLEPSVDALIFDMDGTMIDSIPFHAKSWIEFAGRHSIAMPASEIIAKTNGRTGFEGMELVFGRALSPDEGLALVNEKEAIYREMFSSQFREVDGFKAFEELARKRLFKIGIGTAGDQHNVAFALGHLNLEVVPSVIVSGDMGLRGKPNPDIFLEVARRLDVMPERCIVFEDAPFGIEAAGRAGMRAVGIASTHHESELRGSHVLTVAKNFSHLLEQNFLEN